MECGIFKKYLKENECECSIVPAEIKKHINECESCKKYYQFALILNSQKGVLEKSPKDILPHIENKIRDSIQQSANEETFGRFKYLLKPAFAGFFALLLAIVSYAYLSNKNIGYVENLSERFKIAKFENIKSGDVLFAGNNTIATIRLKGKSKLQIHQNTIVRAKSARHIALSRGEISLLSGDKEFQIETPDGLLLAKNTNTKIHASGRLENGLLKTDTTCFVFNGTLIIKYPLKEIVLNQGQKAVLAENGRITYQKQLTAAESEPEMDKSVKQKLFAAVESLCDCIHSFNYTPAKRGNHLELFGKEVNENKFKVRVFWQEKGLKELVSGPLNEYNKICSTVASQDPMKSLIRLPSAARPDTTKQACSTSGVSRQTPCKT
jgi:antitoxin component YwqK of YwqJK toxin-antitoxin module